MTDSEDTPAHGNIKLPYSDFKRHAERKEEMGVTWSEYIDEESVELQRYDVEDLRRVVREEFESVMSEFRQGAGR